MRRRGGLGTPARPPRGSCGSVASLGIVIRRYLVPRGRTHTPQVVVAPSDGSAGLRRPAKPRGATRTGCPVPAPRKDFGILVLRSIEKRSLENGSAHHLDLPLILRAAPALARAGALGMGAGIGDWGGGRQPQFTRVALSTSVGRHRSFPMPIDTLQVAQKSP